MKRLLRGALVLLLTLCFVLSLSGCTIQDYQLVKAHRLPRWYSDAKFGIMVQSGPSSVPAWALVEGAKPGDLMAPDYFEKNPYAEWYWNTMRIPGSPTARYHADTYGEGYPYYAFGDAFDAAASGYDLSGWAELFARSGARYVVLVTKHHDGYCLWPSAHENPLRPGWHTTRDLVGGLAGEVRARGMRMGIYYSGGLDWTFTQDRVISHFFNLYDSVPQSDEYVSYSMAQWRELIERYRPDILWNDIALPASFDRWALWADYYRKVPGGVVNDRWSQNMLEQAHYLAIISGGEEINPLYHFDFFTPEYQLMTAIRVLKYEVCRGIGHSFGYNRQEEVHTSHLMTAGEAVEMLCDIVSKNGNLLLSVGPRSDGSFPAACTAVLEGLGAWLGVNGRAIYGTRAWRVAEGSADGGAVRVRFTVSDRRNELYAILLDRPAGGSVSLEGVSPTPGAVVRLLGRKGALEWRQVPGGMVVELPEGLPDAPAHALAVSPPP